MAEGHAQARWRTLIAEYQRSGLGQKAFAQSKGISFSSLQYWLYRGRRKKRGAPARPIRLLPVSIRKNSPAEVVPRGDRWVTLTLDGSYRLRFQEGTDCAYVGRLVSTIAACGGRC